MKVKDLSGKIHNWSLKGYIINSAESRPRSELHKAVRELLKIEYPTDNILEEVSVPGEQLYLDFFLPLRKICVEIHGEQHYKYVPHFHGNIQGFIKSKERDARKQKWCEINGIQYIPLKYNGGIDEWRKQVGGI